MTSTAEAIALGAIGTDEPLISVQINRAVGASRFTEGLESGFTAEVSKTVPLQNLVGVIADRSLLPENAILLMCEGNTLNLAASLVENNITLPGPAARRRGDRVTIMIDVITNVLEDAESKQQREMKEQETARLRKEREARDAAKRAEIWAEQQRLKETRVNMIEPEIDEWVASKMGVSQAIQAELLADREALDAWREADKTPVDQHFLVPCSTEEKAEIVRVLQEACSGVMGGGNMKVKIVRAFAIENETLQRRYSRARSLLLDGSSSIVRQRTETQRIMSGAPLLTRLADCNPVVNEYPMWHGTPHASSAGSICRNGFDTGFVGAHATRWGHGFYFADNPSICHGYARGETVNPETGVCHVILMCKVLAGNIKKLSEPPSQEQKEQLTAECLGSGGTFGSASEYHSLCGGDWAYVMAHRDQVLPAYVVVYQPAPRR